VQERDLRLDGSHRRLIIAGRARAPRAL